MDKYGLIGYPLGHSFSRRFFNEKFAAEGIDAVYDNYEIADARMLLDVVRDNPELKGLNCTIPHKQAILPYLDRLSPEAEVIGAVNVIRIRRNAQTGATELEGYNTDVTGFRESLAPMLGNRSHTALVLGTGGASHAVRYALRQLGIDYELVSRTPGPHVTTYEELTPERMKQRPIIVNCTPVGMFPKVDACPPIPYEGIGPEHILFDLIYNPLETTFLRQGRERGAQTQNGLEMLRLQALASWKIWIN